MLEIVNFDDRYIEGLRELSPAMACEILENEDVIRGSVVICLNGEEVVGAGYLQMCSTFKALKKKIAYHHLFAGFKAKEFQEGGEIAATVLILEALKKSYEEIQMAFLGKHVILRIFADAEQTAYIEFLGENGFFADRPMLHMEKELYEDDLSTASEMTVDGEQVVFKEIDLNDPDLAAEYLRVSEASFKVPDSLTDLRYRSRHGMKVYGAVIPGGLTKEDGTKADKLVSSVCTWKENDTTATENIISDRDYRRKGITTALLRYIYGILFEEGEEVVSLSLFSDNLTALRYYIHLGYEVTKVILSMHYEINYEFRPY